MKTQESEDLLSLTCNKRSRSGENTKPIPDDLIFEIFLRLPAKSVARFRCVSKRMASILLLPYFTDLFLTRSLARPKLLFACHKDDHVLFFSSPQPQSLDENPSLLAANCYRLKVPDELSFDIISYSSIKGLVFLGMGHVWMMCNPSTGQSLILPRVKSRRRRIEMKSYFGYDPIEKQYKVLSMTWVINGSQRSTVCEVLTLGGTGEPSWRKIKCPIPHHPPKYDDHICINGVLYYPTVHNSSGDFIIVCFDVRLEKFRFVKSSHSIASPLINYNDKLASLQRQYTFRLHDHKCRINIKLWVLEDAEKQEWSEHTYKLPALCNSGLRVVGMTRTNEIVLSSYRQSWSYYVFYYNIERNTITKVDIQGMEACKHDDVYTFLDHVEDLKLMKVFN